MQDTGPQFAHLKEEQVLDQMREHLDVHAAICMPEDAVCDYPPIYLQIWAMLLQALFLPRDFSKFAVGLPRGHGKSMFMKLLVVFSILFTKKNFILIVGANDELATNILSDIVDILDSDNIRKIFGNWRLELEVDRKNFKKFTFNGRPVILKSVGAGGGMRGIAVKNKRPDLIVFDDAQTDTCADSVTEAVRFRRWFRGTALKTKNPFGCTFIYIGNMYPDKEIAPGQYTCMLRNLQLSPEWTSFIVGGILADGSALWEAVQPLKQLMAEFLDDLHAGTPEIFFAEVMNDPRGSGNANVDISKLQLKIPEPSEIHQGSFIIIDPANDKKNSDDTAIGYFEVYDATPSLQELYAEKLGGPELVHKALELAMEKGCSNIFVESNAYQYSLLGWFEFITEQTGLKDIMFTPLYSGGFSKNSRILDMFRSIVKGDITLGSRVIALVINQIRAFNKLSKDNKDDILDILAYSLKVIAEHEHELTMVGESRIYHEDRLRSDRSGRVLDYSDQVII